MAHLDVHKNCIINLIGLDCRCGLASRFLCQVVDFARPLVQFGQYRTLALGAIGQE
jgi:hypothetical protein